MTEKPQSFQAPLAAALQHAMHHLSPESDLPVAATADLATLRKNLSLPLEESGRDATEIIDDLVKAMGSRRVLWTDPTSWIRTVVFAGPSFRYRFVPGDITDMAEVQDDAFTRELLH